MKLEIFDPPMCCETGICGSNVDPRLVTFASDLEWLKKQGVEVIRYGLSFNPGEFVSNTLVQNTLQTEGNKCLPILFADGELALKASYPSREKLAQICKIGFNEDEAPPVHREENCCCGVDCDCNKNVPKELTKDECGESECDCTDAAAENNCFCESKFEYKRTTTNPNYRRIIFIISFIAIVLALLGIVAIKILF